MPQVKLQNNKSEQVKRQNIQAQRGNTEGDSIDNDLECKEQVHEIKIDN